MSTNPKDIAKMLAYLAALGAVVIVATRVVSKVGNKAAGAL